MRIIVLGIVFGCVLAAGRGEAAPGEVAWSYVADGRWVSHRPAVGADGTVYASDADGWLHAIGPDGVLRWSRHGPTVGGHDEYWVGEADEGPVAVGDDGTIYVAVNLLGPDVQLQAYHPDGSLRWIYTEAGLNVSHGPTVGPDGDVYFVVNALTGGLRVLAPDGEVRVDEPGRPYTWSREHIYGAELAFGPVEDGGPDERLYLGSDIPTGETLSNGSLLAVRLDGRVEWVREGGSQRSSPFGQAQGRPTVAEDGTVLLSGSMVGQAFGVHRFEPSGERIGSYVPSPSHVITEVEAGPADRAYVVSNTRYLVALDGTSLAWRRDLLASIEHGPVVRPGAEEVVVAGVLEDGTTALAAVNAEGSTGWRVNLPAVDGLGAVPTTRVRFAADGERAFVSGRLSDGRWVLYAVDTPEADPGEGGSGGSGGSGGEGGSGGSGGEGGWGGSGGEGGLGGSGGTPGSDKPDGSVDDSGSGCSAAGHGAPFPAVWLLGLAAVRLWRRRRVR